jgi:spore maturation protein CgeB
MRFIFFTHSLVSCWNHGNAHFLRGVVRALQARGHETRVFEPADGWSRQNLIAEAGEGIIARFYSRFPGLRSETCHWDRFDLERALDGADVVLVHEWNDPWLVSALSRHRAAGGRYILLFHDTHHRAVTAPEAMEQFALEGFDGALVFGEALREIYLRRGWASRVWTWHEAADTALFRPLPDTPQTGDLIWIGNWGDDERTAELGEFLLAPVRQLKRKLGLRASIHGVRYPKEALAAIEGAGARYCGWLANDGVPQAFAAHRVTVHVPRRPYASALPGIPTIRVFEALACGIPLVSAPWSDSEGLFRAGQDFLIAKNGRRMTSLLADVLRDAEMAAELARSGLETIRRSHTCAHRVDELLAICAACSGTGTGTGVSSETEPAGPAARQAAQ